MIKNLKKEKLATKFYFYHMMNSEMRFLKPTLLMLLLVFFFAGCRNKKQGWQMTIR